MERDEHPWPSEGYIGRSVTCIPEWDNWLLARQIIPEHLKDPLKVSPNPLNSPIKYFNPQTQRFSSSKPSSDMEAPTSEELHEQRLADAAVYRALIEKRRIGSRDTHGYFPARTVTGPKIWIRVGNRLDRQDWTATPYTTQCFDCPFFVKNPLQVQTIVQAAVDHKPTKYLSGKAKGLCTIGIGVDGLSHITQVLIEADKVSKCPIPRNERFDRIKHKKQMGGFYAKGDRQPY
jgi:hypothetical protein